MAGAPRAGRRLPRGLPTGLGAEVGTHRAPSVAGAPRRNQLQDSRPPWAPPPPPPRNTSSGAAISMATSSGDTALPQPPAPGTPHHGHGLQGHQLQAPLFRVHTIWGPAAQVQPQALGFWGLPAPWKGRRQLTALGSQLHFGLQQRPEGQRGARVSGSPPGCHPAARLGLVPCPTWSSCHRTRTIKIGRDLHDPLVQPSPTTVTH